MSQFTLKLALEPVYSAENFYLCASNEAAYRRVMRWPDWPSHCLIISGETGTGKTHLAQLWSGRAPAVVLEAENMADFEPGSANMVVENIEKLRDEEALLHVFNYTREKGHFLLMTSRLPPAQLPFKLPDLTSRLKAAPQESIASPSDEMLAAVLRKLFADRQLKVEEAAIDYLLPRMERSLAYVHALVETLDSAALEQKKPVTTALIRRVLEATSTS